MESKGKDKKNRHFADSIVDENCKIYKIMLFHHFGEVVKSTASREHILK